MQKACERLVNSAGFQNFIIVVILLAGVLVGISTFSETEKAYRPTLEILDRLILAIFALEILLKMLALGSKPHHFFKDPWNCFDFLIVVVCFLPFGSGSAAVLRLFRLLRVVRLVTAIPRLQLLVEALLKSLPSMGYVCLLMFLLFYIYAVLGVVLFQANDPIHFGDLWLSLLSLFRVVTLEDWTDVMYIQMFGSDNYDGYNQSTDGLSRESYAQPVIAAAYFVSFVLLGTMVMLNLVIGVVINGMDEAQKEIADRTLHDLLSSDSADESASEAAVRENRISKLKKQLEEITGQLDQLK